jgi:hypothetical protein
VSSERRRVNRAALPSSRHPCHRPVLPRQFGT